MLRFVDGPRKKIRRMLCLLSLHSLLRTSQSKESHWLPSFVSYFLTRLFTERPCLEQAFHHSKRALPPKESRERSSATRERELAAAATWVESDEWEDAQHLHKLYPGEFQAPISVLALRMCVSAGSIVKVRERVHPCSLACLSLVDNTNDK